MWNLNFECVAVLWRFYFLCNLLSTPHPQSHPTPLCPLWEWVHVWDEGSLKGFPLHCSSNSRLGLCGEAIQPLCWKPAGFCVYFCVCMCVCFAVVWHPLPSPSLPGIQPKLLLSSPFSLLMSLPILWLTSPLPYRIIPLLWCSVKLDVCMFRYIFLRLYTVRMYHIVQSEFSESQTCFMGKRADEDRRNFFLAGRISKGN